MHDLYSTYITHNALSSTISHISKPLNNKHHWRRSHIVSFLRAINYFSVIDGRPTLVFEATITVNAFVKQIYIPAPARHNSGTLKCMYLKMSQPTNICIDKLASLNFLMFPLITCPINAYIISVHYD